MSKMPSRVMLLALGISLTILGATVTGDAIVPARPHPRAAPTASGATGANQFTLLSYNVAGLPGLLSASDPARNIPQISRLLNLYDVAVIQEDFAYHEQLRSRAVHRFQSDPSEVGPATGMGDGLNRFSRLRFRRFFRSTWQDCHGQLGYGSDCLTAKGFSVAEHEMAPGVAVDVYNIHLDSGDASGDVGARAAQALQLATFMASWSKGKAVIVAGDTNLLRGEEAVYHTLMQAAGLTDACRRLACPNQFSLDRILFRSSDTVQLTPESYALDRRFVSRTGEDLSDHKAVGVVFRWTRGAAGHATRVSSR